MSITEVIVQRVKKGTKSSWERRSEELLKEHGESSPVQSTTVTFLYGGGAFGVRGSDRIMTFLEPLKEGNWSTADRAKDNFFRTYGTTARGMTEQLSNAHNIIANENVSLDEIAQIRQMGGSIYLSQATGGTTNPAVAGLPLLFYYISTHIITRHE